MPEEVAVTDLEGKRVRILVRGVVVNPRESVDGEPDRTQLHFVTRDHMDRVGVYLKLFPVAVLDHLALPKAITVDVRPGLDPGNPPDPNTCYLGSFTGRVSNTELGAMMGQIYVDAEAGQVGTWYWIHDVFGVEPLEEVASGACGE